MKKTKNNQSKINSIPHSKIRQKIRIKKKSKTPFIAILLVIFCTVLTSVGQVFLKIGSSRISGFSAITILNNVPLLIGCVVYGLGAIVLIIALKNGELSVLYPFIALSFIWVTLLSMWLFSDVVTLINWTGIFVILVGVSLIGYGSRK